MFGRWGNLIVIPVLYWINFKYRPKCGLSVEDFIPRRRDDHDDD